MEEVVELIVSLARKVGELAIANKELREANERLNRQIEGMKPFMKDEVKADADATATVAKQTINDKNDGQGNT